MASPEEDAVPELPVGYGNPSVHVVPEKPVRQSGQDAERESHALKLLPEQFDRCAAKKFPQKFPH